MKPPDMPLTSGDIHPASTLPCAFRGPNGFAGAQFMRVQRSLCRHVAQQRGWRFGDLVAMTASLLGLARWYWPRPHYLQRFKWVGPIYSCLSRRKTDPLRPHVLQTLDLPDAIPSPPTPCLRPHSGVTAAQSQKHCILYLPFVPQFIRPRGSTFGPPVHLFLISHLCHPCMPPTPSPMRWPPSPPAPPLSRSLAS